MCSCPQRFDFSSCVFPYFRGCYLLLQLYFKNRFSFFSTETTTSFSNPQLFKSWFPYCIFVHNMFLIWVFSAYQSTTFWWCFGIPNNLWVSWIQGICVIHLCILKAEHWTWDVSWLINGMKCYREGERNGIVHNNNRKVFMIIFQDRQGAPLGKTIDVFIVLPEDLKNTSSCWNSQKSSVSVRSW